MPEIIEPTPDAPPGRTPPKPDGPDPGVVKVILDGYKTEGEEARKSGENPRDTVWDQNWRLYWGRHDFAKKAPWQAKEVLPDPAQLVDRWSALLADTLVQPGEWYDLRVETDTIRTLEPMVRKLMDYILARCGRDGQGHELAFPSVFEETMKSAAVSMPAATVTWRDTRDGGYVSIEPQDARAIWLDPTGRNLYRRRRIEIDLHQLIELAELENEQGDRVYRTDVIGRMLASMIDSQREDEHRVSSGSDRQIMSTRQPVILDEYVATLIAPGGEVLADSAWCIIANEAELILGPAPNPFAHQDDWLVIAPTVVVPGSPYGRTYMENWAGVSRSLNEWVNILEDAGKISVARAFAGNSDRLRRPEQLSEGVYPGVIFDVEEGDARDFMHALEMGQTPREGFAILEYLQKKTQDGALLNDIMLGQPTGQGGVTATEIGQASSAATSQLKSMARTIEARFLEPLLNLAWRVALQHLDFQHPAVVAEIGEPAARMFAARRQEFMTGDLDFRVRGLSSVIDRMQQLRRFLSLLQTIAAAPPLLQSFLSKYPNWLDVLVSLHGLDLSGAEPTEAEKQMALLAAAQGQPAPQRAGQMVSGQPGQPGAKPNGQGLPGAVGAPPNAAGGVAQMMQGAGAGV